MARGRGEGTLFFARGENTPRRQGGHFLTPMQGGTGGTLFSGGTGISFVRAEGSSSPPGGTLSSTRGASFLHQETGRGTLSHAGRGGGKRDTLLYALLVLRIRVII